MISRSLFDTDGQFTLSETRVDWRAERFRLGTNYLFAAPEPSEDREVNLEEWSFDGAYDINDRWTADANWRYDFNANRGTRTRLGLGYRTECIDLALSVSRRFADSTSVDPTTELGFRISLTGIGGRGSDTTRLRRCRG